MGLSVITVWSEVESHQPAGKSSKWGTCREPQGCLTGKVMVGAIQVKPGTQCLEQDGRCAACLPKG